MHIGEPGGPFLLVRLLEGNKILIICIANVWQLVAGYVIAGGMIYWRYRKWKNKNKTS